MNFELRELKKSDYPKVIDFAIKGMHFDWYMDSEFLLKLYGKYFLYLELNRATQVFCAYAGDELAGVLLAEIKGEKKKYYSLSKAFYVGIFNLLQKIFARDGIDVYDEANKEMFRKYLSENKPDGEIIFLAGNPDIKVKGTGTFLLRQLEKAENGKKVFLYTDNACTYQFYEHRGFERAGEKDIVLKLAEKTVPLRCMLYSKTLNSGN